MAARRHVVFPTTWPRHGKQSLAAKGFQEPKSSEETGVDFLDFLEIMPLARSRRTAHVEACRLVESTRYAEDDVKLDGISRRRVIEAGLGGALLHKGSFRARAAER